MTIEAVYRGLVAEALQDASAGDKLHKMIMQLAPSVRQTVLDQLSRQPEQALPQLGEGLLPKIFLSSDDIMGREWGDPVWVVNGILPAGLSILAGAPKMGKSWLALQIALGMGTGGQVLGRQCTYGKTLYVALEDGGRRLKTRMKLQDWGPDVKADFILSEDWRNTIGDLTNGGIEKLTDYIAANNWKLVVIDTLSRAISKKQKEVEEMTLALAPLQELAITRDIAVLFIDHHRKSVGETPDAVGDILGSIGKGAVSDVQMGLYRKRGEVDGRLSISGRDVEELTIPVRMNWDCGKWELGEVKEKLPLQQERALDKLREIGEPTTLADLARALGAHSGALFHTLDALMLKQKVSRDGSLWYALGA